MGGQPRPRPDEAEEDGLLLLGVEEAAAHHPALELPGRHGQEPRQHVLCIDYSIIRLFQVSSRGINKTVSSAIYLISVHCTPKGEKINLFSFTYFF